MHAELELGLERRIGKRSAAVIEKHLGITTVGGLLNYFPRRYLSRGELTPISEVPLDEEVTLIARVVSNSTRHMRARRGSLTDVVISDDAGGPAVPATDRAGAAGHAQGQLLQRLPGQGGAPAGPARHVFRQSHPLRRLPGPDQPRFPAARRGPRHPGHGSGEARRHADPGVPGHGKTHQLVHPEGHLDAAGHRGPRRPRRPAARGDRGAGEIPAGRGRLPADPRPGSARPTGSAPGTGSATRRPWCCSRPWPGAAPSWPPRKRRPGAPRRTASCPPSTASCRSR